MQRVGGIIEITADGLRIVAAGDFTYNLGRPKRTPILGPSTVLGYSETAQEAYIEGETVHTADLDLAALVGIKNATIDLTLPNGKTVVLREAAYVADGEGSTGEGRIKVRFSGTSAEII